ncbi:MAG: peptidase domain-containing ABC transporter [Bacilli bacterium]
MTKDFVVRQSSARDCGACCLLSIIKYYQGYVPLEKIKLDSHTNINGTTAFHLVNCANKYGFDGIGIKCNIKDLQTGNVILPLIAHIKTQNNLFHFVVIYKVEKDNFKIMDPAKGMIKMKIEDFQKIWDGIAILLRPREKITILPRIPNITEVLYSVFKTEKKTFIKIILFSIIITLLSIFLGFHLKIMTNIMDTSNRNFFHYFLIFFIIVSSIKLVSEYYKKSLCNALNKNIDALFIIPFIKHIFNLPSNVVVSKPNGELITRVNDLANIKSLFTEILTTVFIDLILALSSIYFLITLNKNLFFILCLIVILYLLVTLVFNPFVYRKINDNIDRETDFNAQLVEKISSVNSIKNLHIESYINDMLEQSSVLYIKDSYYLNKFILSLETIHKIISELGTLLIMSIGLILIYNNKLTLINLVTFSTLATYFFDPIKNITSIIPKYNLIKLSINKVTEFNAIKEEKIDKENDFHNGNISVSDLSYSYDDYHKVLDKESFTITKGEKVFLKGKSGSGKSTICKLLMKYATNYQGCIKIGEVDIKDYTVASIRNNITYVSQNESLFTDTIRNNLTLNKDISIEELNKVITICDLENVIATKPLRLDTMLIDGGINLSGGEKQRIILARALLQNKNIIILDEALSELDLVKEESIIKRIKKEYKDKTVIYIAHRDLQKLFNKTILIGGSNELLQR